ncbi:MAG: phosphate acyltransferase, partial [Lachnospiraceae bacterium]|nr:phosphate acyltransferase [Lachnospiraceae bacterium]
VNIGAEEEKGNALSKETYQLLKQTEGINFIGNVEARDIPAGKADIIVTEAFTGNVILKLYEGLANTLVKKIKQGLMSTLRSKIGALLIKPALKKTMKSFDSAEYGGAPLLGLRGLVVKTHGSSKSLEIKNSILQCIKFTEQDLPGMISANLQPKEK